MRSRRPIAAGERLERGVRFDSGFHQGTVGSPIPFPAFRLGVAREPPVDHFSSGTREPVGKDLGNERDLELGPALDEPRVGLPQAGQYRQERGLAGPVAAGHAYPLAFIEGKLDVLEQDLGADGRRDPPHPQQRHGREGYRREALPRARDVRPETSAPGTVGQ